MNFGREKNPKIKQKSDLSSLVPRGISQTQGRQKGPSPGTDPALPPEEGIKDSGGLETIFFSHFCSTAEGPKGLMRIFSFSLFFLKPAQGRSNQEHQAQRRGCHPTQGGAARPGVVPLAPGWCHSPQGVPGRPGHQICEPPTAPRCRPEGASTLGGCPEILAPAAISDRGSDRSRSHPKHPPV